MDVIAAITHAVKWFQTSPSDAVCRYHSWRWADIYREALQHPKVEVWQPCGHSSQWLEMPVEVYRGIPLLPTAFDSFVHSKRAGHAWLMYVVKRSACTHKQRLCLSACSTHTPTHSVIFLSTCTSLLCWLILLIIIITLVAGTFQIFCAHNFTLLVNRFSKCFQSLLQFYEAQCGALPGNECNSWNKCGKCYSCTCRSTNLILLDQEQWHKST